MEEDADEDFIRWSFNTPPTQLQAGFIGSTGPKHGVSPENGLPIDYFNLFIPMYFWSRFATYTNTKASMATEEAGGNTRRWSNTCGAEIKAWFASVMFWCICKSLTFEQFWEGNIDPQRVKKWFPNYTRWAQIKRFLKISDPMQDPNNKHNRMFKVQELFDFFINACKANYWPDVCVALDEAIKKFKGRCVFKQYIKGKPVRWGIKIFCVCCSVSSYLFNAYFYIGKQEDDNTKEASVTQKTVLKLMEPLAGKNHRVYMDNYYTGIPLIRELEKMDIFTTGTVRTNRKGLDKQVTIKKTEEKHLKKKPGYTRYSSCGNLVYAAWFDKRPVHMLSNCHPPIGDDTVEHWYTAKAGEQGATETGKILKEISICPIVKWYRKWMGAVDRFDQFRAYLKFEMRSGKFWHPMMWFIVESAMVNAYILYKITRQSAKMQVLYSHFQFRLAVCMALVAEWEDMGCVYVPPEMKGLSPGTRLESVTAKKLRLSFGVDDESRYTSSDFHFGFRERIPHLDGQKSKYRQLYCVVSNCGRRSSFWCRQCHAPLCYPECYVHYHTRPAVHTGPKKLVFASKK